MGTTFANGYSHDPRGRMPESTREVAPRVLGGYPVSIVHGKQMLVLRRGRECLRSSAVVLYPTVIDLAEEECVAVHFAMIANRRNSVASHSHASSSSKEMVRSSARLVFTLRQCHSAT